MTISSGETTAELEEEYQWLRGPACKAGAHPTIFHHQHMIGPAKWHCSCGQIERPAKSRWKEE